MKSRKSARKILSRFTSAGRSSPAASSKPDSVSTCFHILVILSAAALSFVGNIDGDFVFDDREAILNNKAVREIDKLWKTDFWGYPISSARSHKSYRPITTITFALNYVLSGFHSISYHAVNIALHNAVCVLLYKVLLELCGIFDVKYPSRMAFRTSLLFAVHPIHSEAVANVVGRAELLMALFTFLVLYCYIKSWCKSRFSIRSIVMISVFSTLALFSKEQGIVALPLCAVFDIMASKLLPSHFFAALRKRREDSQNNNDIDVGTKYLFLVHCACMRRMAIFFSLCMALLALRFSINGFQLPQFSTSDNLIAGCPSIVLRLYPMHLCFDYSMGCIPLIESITDPRLIISALFALATVLLIVQLIRGYFEQHRLELFAVLFYALTFLPASNIFVTVGFAFAERILYLPSVAFCLLIVCLCERLEQFLITDRRRNILRSGLVMIVIALISRSYERSIDWKNELDLYRSGLLVCPNNAKIHYNIGKILSDSGDTESATVNYANAIRLNPTYEQAMNNLANIYLKRNRSSDAEQLLRKAVKIRPNFAAAWMNLGVALLAQKKYEDAENSFEQALSLRFPYPDCLYNMGLLYLQQNRKVYAKQIWQNVTREKPNHRQAWLNLLVLLDETGKCSEAVSLASKVLTYHGNEAAILSQLGTCYGKLGQYDSAEKMLLTAVRLDRTNAAYWNNIGTLYKRWDKSELAKFAYQRALQLQPQSELATVHQYINQWETNDRFALYDI